MLLFAVLFYVSQETQIARLCYRLNVSCWHL